MPSTSRGTAVVMALMEEPDGPKLMVEAMENRCTFAIHGVLPGTFSMNW